MTSEETSNFEVLPPSNKRPLEAQEEQPWKRQATDVGIAVRALISTKDAGIYLK
jgi:hypothetical protein